MPLKTSNKENKVTRLSSEELVAPNSAVKRRRTANRSSNQERVATEKGFDSEDKEQSSKEELVPAANRRRAVTRKSSQELVVAANSVNKRCRIANRSSNEESVATEKGTDLEDKEESLNEELVPAAKRRVVTRSSDMKLSNRKRVSVKSSGAQPSSQETGSRTTVKSHRLLIGSSNQRIDTGTVRRHRVVKRSSETLPSKEELFPLSNQMVDIVEATHNNLSKLSKSIPDDFETYKRLFLKWRTTIVKENVLLNSTCNCPAFGTEYICKHIAGLAIRMRLVTPPPEAKTIPIGEKRKPGRPAKTKPALMIQ